MRRLLFPFLLVPVVVIIALGLVLVPHRDSPPVAFAGTVLTDRGAPNFHLRDQFGHQISLRQFRGHPVVLTFIEANCTTLCPIEAEKIRQSLSRLGPAGKQVAVLAVTTAPEDDTPAAVRTFSLQHGMWHRWHFLTAARPDLVSIWNAYYVYAAPAHAPASLRDNHTSATYVIDAQGHERVIFTSDLTATALDRDLRILLGMPVQPSGEAAIPLPQSGHVAPPFTLTRLSGGGLSLSALRGKVVLVNFWSTWCTACRAEMPELNRWYQHWKNRGFVVLGVDQEEGASDVAAYVRKVGVRYPIVLDSSGLISGRYDLIGLPDSFLIDRSGVVRVARLGEVGKTDLRQQVQALLAKRGETR